jgi:hypothetical protein
MRKAYTILAGNLKERDQFGDLGEDNIKMFLKETGYTDVDWNNQA